MNDAKSIEEEINKNIDDFRKKELERRLSNIFPTIRANAVSLVLPSLVAIYQSRTPRPGSQQIGTGFLVSNNGAPIIITAAHALYGHSFSEDPDLKEIFLDDRLITVGSLRQGEIACSLGNDLAAFHAPGFSVERCLPVTSVTPPDPDMRLVSIAGYLALDFKINKAQGALRPKPLIYSNAPYPYKDGYVGILRPKHRNRDTLSGQVVMVPIPAGLSGGPMIDGLKLWRGEVKVVGVFTDMNVDIGRGFGESSSKVITMLEGM